MAVTLSATEGAFSNLFSQTQNIGVGTLTPDNSAVLDLSPPNNDKGLLVPRLTAAQRIAIVNPANSLLVFDTDSNCFFFYASSNAKWNSLCGSYNQKTILCSDFTASKNIANTSEQILKSCTIPANYLSSNGTWVEIESFVNINPSSLSSPKDTIYLKVKLANITIDSVQFFVTPAQPIVKYISNIRISNTIQKIVSIQGQVPSVYNFNLSTNLTVDFIMQISSPDANVVSYETISIRKIE